MSWTFFLHAPLGDTSSEHHGSSGNNPRRIPIRKISSTKNALSKKIADLDQMLNAMRKQREDLEIILQTIRRWSAELRSVDRTSLGVPYIRAVKNVLGEWKAEYSSSKSPESVFGKLKNTPLSNFASVPANHNLKSRLVLSRAIQLLYFLAQLSTSLDFRLLLRKMKCVIRKWSISLSGFGPQICVVWSVANSFRKAILHREHVCW